MLLESQTSGGRESDMSKERERWGQRKGWVKADQRMKGENGWGKERTKFFLLGIIGGTNLGLVKLA